jgi:protein-L-isoaspartate(D-aspartate) O-methyltransferase
MVDFALMRSNMVKNQVLPEEVTNSVVIEALATVPRERFVPRQLARIAYMDDHLPFNKGRMLLRPALFARLLQALNPVSTDKVLYIGCGTGYGPALLGQMGLRVIAIDSEESLTQEADRLLTELNLLSVEVVLGPLTEGWATEAPYDKMMIEGSIDFIPQSLLSQLKERGEIITLRYRKDHGNDAVKYIKQEQDLEIISLFDAFAPRLEGFHRTKAFVF